MKRIVSVLSFVLLSTALASAQLLGDGSMTNPYRGTLAGDFTISGTKYFTANFIVDNEKLTISAGAKLISVHNKAILEIRGTGQIDAQGTSVNPILFSVDLDLDGINGESAENWGNITITSSGTSTLKYCIIEKGQRTEVKLGSYGGGLYLGSSGITVTNTTIRNCRAIKGGGAIVAGAASPVISNCVFSGNIANDHGGAIYITAGSSPVISNTLFYDNSAQSSTLKGGSIASIGSTPKILNSVIAYSSSPASDGTSIYLENSSGAVVVNTILWGGSNHIGLSGTPSSVFNYCAIEGASYTGCINLNSNNTATDGPNFINPGSRNFDIIFDSPCRDSGASSYSGVTIPSTDIVGTERIGTTDIGAYEFIYSRWMGVSNDWSKAFNWERGFAPGTRNIIIPSGKTYYPTLGPGPSFTLNSGLKMIMEPGAKATFTSLTNNGTIYINSGATGIASLLTGSFSGSSGSLNVKLFIKGGSPSPGLYRWHYIAAPVTSSKTVFTVINPYNLLNYDQSKVTTDIAQGWQWHDGYGGTTAFSNLEAKRGYNVFNNTDATLEFNNLTSLTTSMGQINLPYSGLTTDTALYGYSLIGNSLTCGLNWDLVTRSNTTYVRNAIYITTDDNVASYVNGVGTNGGTAHIPPLQGFFVKTRASGTYITIPDNAREHNSTVRFKSAASSIPLVRIELTNGTIKDETVVRLENQATLKFDNEFDAGKMFGPVGALPQIYSTLNGENYSINSLPWPQSQTIIPLTLRIPSSGTYKIRRTELQNIGNSRVTLTDNNTGTVTDLSLISEYSFNAESGTLTGRFLLTVIAGTAGINAANDLSMSMNIYSSSGSIYIMPVGTQWNDVKGRVKIYDLTGRVIFNGRDELFNEGELKEYTTQSGGMFIIEVVTEKNERILKKVVITK